MGPADDRIRSLSPPVATAWLVLGVTALRLLVAGRVGLGTDEAHYALYGSRLDWSYFDHPPLVGWTSALFQQLGSSELVLRLPAILIAAATAALVYRLARALFPEAPRRHAFWSVALVQGGLMFHGMGLALLPEDLLLLFGLGALLALVAVLEGGGVRAWLALGACLGFAGLGKYTAVLLVPTVIGALCFERRPSGGFTLAWLASPGPWLAAALAALIVSPVFAWNALRDWISFRYQMDHGATGDAWGFGRFAASTTIPLLAYAPITFVAGWGALLAAPREWSHRGVRLSTLAALPVLLVFSLAGGTELSLPHWTAFGWAALAPASVRWIAARWRRSSGGESSTFGEQTATAASPPPAEPSPRGSWVHRLTIVSAGWSVLVLALLYSLLLHPWIPFPAYRQPLAALTGWDQAADHATELIEEGSRDGGPPLHLYSDNWSRAGRLAWYARPTPVQVLDTRRDQFDLWFGNPEPGERGVLVVWDGSGDDDEPRDLALFERTELLDELPIDIAGVRAAVFRFYGCDGYRGAQR